MNIQVGNAPDSWGVWLPEDPRQTPWPRFLDEVAGSGYEWIELGPYGYLPTDRSTLQRELAKRGLRVCATNAIGRLWDASTWQSVEKQAIDSGELAVALGAKFLILIEDTYFDLFTGQATAPRKLDSDSWKRLADFTQRIGGIARERFGLQMVFHPCADTHVEYEDQIEKLLADTDPEVVSLCLDTGHHAYRGGDPVAFMKKHHERIPHLHLKNVDRQLQQKVEADGTPFGKAVEMGIFCEPGEGLVDFLKLRDVLREVNYRGFAVVEQDIFLPPLEKPLPIAKRTREYLRRIGIG